MKKLILKKVIQEQKKEDVDFDPEALGGGMNVPPHLKKLLAPDLPPAKFADLDARLDDTGTVAHQAFAIVAYALSYSDGDEGGAKDILRKAQSMLPKVAKAKEKNKDNQTTSE